MSEANEGMDVGYVAHLARIDLTSEETALFQGQLNQVLQYVEQLNELDVEGVEPMAHAIPVYNVLRKDELGLSLDHADVVANAPSSSDGHIRVPKIIDQ
ncbi:Asp-tRNA(Asn)/Glu-tRNA(Gln) amidotransferase subunit GatC [Pontiella sulfatireligans]|uniref:Aspartyl/glutamyl-tRNA(Asn/Gln) amidotransferase subunit C n=1 Tax=Pontiella sulfatireligans TaxID=2750658 RepID=A0A6C2UIS5_9BACT|nr:Asp-tRNA(Asn)/Glu-tRNA(Gln) amidotransferase subunit GatC [Pontiella sulfatireligans]VGO20115.1 Glutamyl-tRNA(Gln) amidotransferase subunit C [Pontiella sulfatireligans]